MSPMALLVAAALAVFGPNAPAAGTGAEACPLDGIRGLGRAPAHWLDAAGGRADGDARCARKAALASRLFDADEPAGCRAEPPPGAEAGASPDPDELSLLAALAWRCGDAEAALELARAALAADPGSTLAWRVVGRVLAARFRPADARGAYERALALDPDDAGSLWGLAGVERDRATRKATLRRYLAAAKAREEPEERRRAAEQMLEFVEALGERPVWRVKSAEVPGTIRARPLVTRPGSVDGYLMSLEGPGARRFRALIDSGASGLHLSPTIARKLEIEPLVEAVLFGGGGDGEHEVQRGLLEELDLGPIVFGNAVGAVASRSLHPTGAYQAIVGLNVLSGLVLRLDVKQRELSLEKGAPPPPEDDPLAIEPFDVGDGWVPILDVEGQLLVPVEFASKGGAEGRSRALGLLDTGASDTLLSLRVAEGRPGLRLGGERAGRGYGGEIAYHGLLRRAFVTLSGHGRRLRDVPVIELSKRTRLTGVRVDAILGWDFFGEDVLEIDLAQGRARLIPARTRRR